MKMILTLYTSIPDNTGAEKRVIAGDFEVDDSNVLVVTAIGDLVIRRDDIQMGVALPDDADLSNLPEHIWLLN